MGNKKPVFHTHNRKVIPLQLNATFFFEKAIQSLERFRYDRALKYFRRAVEYDPGNPVNHCNLAGILSELGNYEESNEILIDIVTKMDPEMTECYFYLASNYVNMEEYELAEKALLEYLEKDENGQYLEDAEEMMDYLSTELGRPTPMTHIKCRENLVEHDKARMLLEQGRFTEASLLLEDMIQKHPEFLAARNNLSLAYYYMGQLDKSIRMIHEVLRMEPGNLHALCNLAIFYQHTGQEEELSELLTMLKKMVPFHYEHLFKLAMTLGLLGDHETAYQHFKRLLKETEFKTDPSLYHYAAVACYHTKRYREAEKLWKKSQHLDPDSDIPKFYISELQKLKDGMEPYNLSYHYHLPFEEHLRQFEHQIENVSQEIQCDPLIRSSFIWALYHGDHATKLQVIQVLGMIGDGEVEHVLRDFLLRKEEDEYLKKVAIFALRTMGAKDPIHAVLEGKEVVIYSSPLSPDLPVWQEQWQAIMDIAIQNMDTRYDMLQKHDMQTLWVEFLTKSYPHIPHIQKKEGWSAALEYLTAKMHRRTVSYKEVSERYRVSIATVRKNVNIIDEVCGLREKMNTIFSQYSHKF